MLIFYHRYVGHVPFVFDNLLSYFAVYVYYFQATITMALAYTGYVRLFFFQNVSKKRSIYWPFMGGFAASAFMALCQTCEMVQGKIALSNTITVVLASIRAMVQLLVFIVVTSFYVMAFLQAAQHAFQAKLGTIRQSRWNLFRSVLMYCLLPNAFTLVAIPDSICSATMSKSITATDRLSNFDVFCVHIYAVTQYINPPRLFVISISALIAFEEYRQGCSRNTQNIMGLHNEKSKNKKVACGG
ncbi:hypothetical protein L596_013854 [Steinernema carpocapsae]|uniref:Serpentine receptor class gamma n=1 Tax=Steinernema carpocapsae TaxID=34508 RepID=A0A4U5P235_STECR|nr:hypothetical protein L596_013854 [Steinernema carpocapsae]